MDDVIHEVNFRGQASSPMDPMFQLSEITEPWRLMVKVISLRICKFTSCTLWFIYLSTELLKPSRQYWTAIFSQKTLNLVQTVPIFGIQTHDRSTADAMPHRTPSTYESETHCGQQMTSCWTSLMTDLCLTLSAVSLSLTGWYETGLKKRTRHFMPNLLPVGQVEGAKQGVILRGGLAHLILVQEDRRAAHFDT